jgi:arabinogalactan endo-1,4-beta-galactosidase
MNVRFPLLSTILLSSCLAGAVSDATAGGVWSDCVPVLTGTFANRIHVKCASSVSGGIRWFAVDNLKTDYANRFMSIVNTALVSGKTLSVYYDPGDTSATAFGCGAKDCRKAIGINMR